MDVIIEILTYLCMAAVVFPYQCYELLDEIINEKKA